MLKKQNSQVDFILTAKGTRSHHLPSKQLLLPAIVCSPMAQSLPPATASLFEHLRSDENKSWWLKGSDSVLPSLTHLHFVAGTAGKKQAEDILVLPAFSSRQCARVFFSPELVDHWLTCTGLNYQESGLHWTGPDLCQSPSNSWWDKQQQVRTVHSISTLEAIERLLGDAYTQRLANKDFSCTRSVDVTQKHASRVVNGQQPTGSPAKRTNNWSSQM